MQQLVELPQGRMPLKGRMRPQGVVLPAPAVSQGLGLGHGVKRLGVREFMPEPAVERLSRAVLPR